MSNPKLDTYYNLYGNPDLDPDEDKGTDPDPQQCLQRTYLVDTCCPCPVPRPWICPHSSLRSENNMLQQRCKYVWINQEGGGGGGSL